MNQIQNDEIDVFDLFQTLWDGKWLISAFIVLATLMGFGYTQFVQPKYNVSVPHTINIHSLNTKQTCHDSLACMELLTKKRLLYFLKAGWGSNLSLSTTTPLGLSEYQAQIKYANEALTNDVYVNAKREFSFIQTEMADALFSTETVARKLFNARWIIDSIDSGQSAITFGSVSIVKSSLKVQFILALSIALGGMFGMFFIIVRSAIKKRKEQLAKEK
jgi:hypothetical protein